MLLVGNPPRRQEMGRYLNKLGEGMPSVDAWQQVFGTLPIEKDLEKYVRQRSFTYSTYKFTEKLASFDPVVAPIPAADAEALQADFLVQLGREDEAAERLAKVKTPGDNAWTTVVTALIEMSKKDYAAAEKRLTGLQETGDWLLSYRAGAALADLVEERRETPGAETIAAARRLFGGAVAHDREIPNSVARQLSLELARDEPPPAAARMAIERARLMSPGRLDYVFLHARVLAAQSEFPAARRVLSPLMTPAYPPDIREAARSLMGYIVRVEQFTNGRNAANTVGSAAANGGAATSAADGSSSDSAAPTQPGGAGRQVMQPIFRKLAAGEERLEGRLEQIDCSRSGVVFHVASSVGITTLAAPRMQEVEFITFRDDLTGAVTCGRLKEALPVYVTWKPGTGGASKTVVAVEFLPK
jgi:hypothetical protein